MKQGPAQLACVLLLAYLSSALFDSPQPWAGQLRSWNYDWAYTAGLWRSKNLDDSPVTILYLDLNAYQAADQNPNLPFPRELHASVLERLTEMGVKAVVYDIIFSGLSLSDDPNADERFAQAIASHQRVILGADLVTRQNTTAQERASVIEIEYPFEPFHQAAAAWGLATVRPDIDFVVRTFFPGFLDQAPAQPSLAIALGQTLGLPLPEQNDRLGLHYYGPPLTIPHLSLSQLLIPGDIDPERLKDQIVIIGARSTTQAFDERRDEFRSPFGSWGERDVFIPGVEIHATQIINLIQNDWIHTPSLLTRLLLLAVSALILVAAAFRLSIRAMLGFGGGFAFLVFVGGIVIHHEAHLSLPWAPVVLVQTPLIILGNIAGRSTLWYRQRRAFVRAKQVADAKIEEQATLLARAHDAIVVMDPTGQLLYRNESASQLFSPTLPSSENSEVLPLWEGLPGTTLAQARQQTLQQGVWEGEFQLPADKGGERFVESRWTQIRGHDGEVQSIMAISSDVTEKRQLEQQLLRTQRMETIGALAGGVAHDLNNALSPILMGVQLMRREAHSDKTTRMLDVMETSTKRGADMVRQILAFTRGTGEGHHTVNLKALIRDIERLIKETFPKHIEIQTFIANDLWSLQANPTQLHQVLLNLCVNARDAMPDGGQLTLAVDNHTVDTPAPALVGSKQPGRYVLIMLSDTGIGIPPDKMAQVFEPFYTTKAADKGTGLGLTTVRTIVEKHHGFIDLSTAPNSGTSFDICLPAQEAGQLASKTDGIPSAPMGRGEGILVADDEQAIREMLLSTLEASGYQPVAVRTGAEALSKLEEAANDFQLVVLDEDMPMISGRQCMQEIHERHPRIATLLISGELTAPASKAPTPQCAELSKPFRVEDLLEEVDRLIRNTR